MSRLKQIENEILSIKRGVVQTADIDANGTLFTNDAELLAELETKRRFLLDRRESWLPKTIWNLFIPIVVSFVVTILTLWLQK